MKQRTKQPKNNKYYIRLVSGGLNGAVEGDPAIAGANVLCNCVGYANGRFNEIINDPDLKGVNKAFKYQLVCNAENFIESAKAQGLKVSKKPVQGGIMVWQKGATLGGGDGAGHVAVVEAVYDDGTIITSESGWASWAFKRIKRDNANGRWGQNSLYKFRGCIINPSAKSEVIKPFKYKPSTPYKGKLPKGTVKEGDKSADVKRMKAFLNWCCNTKFTGKGGCGEGTVKALKRWEKTYGLEPDGVWGPACLKKAQEIVEKYAAKKSKYYSKTTQIGQACANESGKLPGGKAGDQTGGEVKISPWSTSYGWKYVIRLKDKSLRNKLAQAAIDTCENDHIGYDTKKPDRYTAWDLAEKNGHDIKGIKKRCETTCSQLVSMCLRAVGVPKKYAKRHYDIAAETKALLHCPLVDVYKDKNHTQSAKYLQPGDILLSSHHTAIVVKSPNAK